MHLISFNSTQNTTMFFFYTFAPTNYNLMYTYETVHNYL